MQNKWASRYSREKAMNLSKKLAYLLPDIAGKDRLIIRMRTKGGDIAADLWEMEGVWGNTVILVCQ